MQPAAQKPLLYIENDSALQDCLKDLRKQTSIAFDLEFDSHSYAYGFTLCLIQVATTEACYVIDPLKGLQLSPLYALFEDAGIQKIVHSPGEDLRLLHSLQCFPKNLFDTEVVARLLNYEQTSLAAMLQEKLGHTMSKGQQRSNWLKRPLTREQLAYAADDVAWLHPLKEALVDEAAPNGLMPFVAEEQEALGTTIHTAEAKTSFLKAGDRDRLSPYDQHVLNGLFLYRDSLARELNKPAYHIMDEGLLRDLAGGRILPADLPNAKGLYGSFKNNRFATELATRLAAIRKEGADLSHAAPPRRRMSPEDWKAKEEGDRDKEEKFGPVQAVLAERFGQFAARFILSNGLVTDIIRRAQTISGLRPYRQLLIRDIAASLGIDLSAYY